VGVTSEESERGLGFLGQSVLGKGKGKGKG
jgi:hypothetical protein